MKRIFFASSDPGGANVIAATIRRLPRGATYRLFTDQQGYRVPALAERYEVVDLASVPNVFSAGRPDVVFTGTSITSDLELHFIREGSARGCRTAAVIDHWTNFSRRFRWPDGKRELPDVVLVPDSAASSMAAADGLPASRLRVYGQPHFTDAASFRPATTRGEFWRGSDVDPASKVVLFLSDALTETAGSEELAEAQFGYTESAICAHVLDALAGHPEVTVVVRPHPKERPGKFVASLNPPRMTLAPTAPLWETIAHSDHVIGMFSSAIVEAAALGKLPLRVEIGAGGRDFLPVPPGLYFARVVDRALLRPTMESFLVAPPVAKRPGLFAHDFESVISDLLR